MGAGVFVCLFLYLLCCCFWLFGGVKNMPIYTFWTCRLAEMGYSMCFNFDP